MLKSKRFLRILAGVLSVSLLTPAGFMTDAGRTVVEAAAIPQAAYKWTFEDVTETDVANSGTVSDGKAALQGTAKIEQQQLTVSGKNYSDASNHVLTLAGGTKGSSYVDLPANLYDGVSETTGLTWSFWMKSSSEVASYSRLFSSADSTNK